MTQKEKIVDTKHPYSSQEVLVHNFKIIEALLTTTFDALSSSFVKPMAIIHPIDKVGDKLTDREERLFIELGLSGGARSVKLWLGSELNDEDILGGKLS